MSAPFWRLRTACPMIGRTHAPARTRIRAGGEVARIERETQERSRVLLCEPGVVKIFACQKVRWELRC